MSAPAAATQRYDRIYDAQRHFRTLLDCTSRPGTLGLLEDVDLEVPAELRRSTALLALTLLGPDTSFSIVPGPAAASSSFLREQTAAIEAPVTQADFLIVLEAAHPEQWKDVRIGTLTSPETAATAFVQVREIAHAPMAEALRLRLTGPGIERESVIFVSGLAESFFAARQERNAEFPLGLDMFLACDSLSAGPSVLSLPRTTLVSWERI